MTALDDFIENLAQNVTAPGNQPVVCTVDLFIAAMQLVQTSIAATAAGASNVTGGRLTLVTATPVLTTDVTAITTVFFALYNGDKTLINQGAGVFAAVTHGELSQTLADNTKSPAAAAADSLYDLFVWEDAAPGGTVRCTRGPAWTNATTRALALTRINGVLVNDTAITNGPGANLGTYVGTIATDATPDLNMIFAPAAAAGGAGNRLDVWNMYNQVPVTSVNLDSTATWNYSVATWRAKNNNALNGITFVQGLAQAVAAMCTMTGSSTNAQGFAIAWGLDSVIAPYVNSPVSYIPSHVANKFSSSDCFINPFVGIGRHVLTPLEISAAGGTTTWQNNTGAITTLCPARIELMM